jgi:hypothetical protein
MRARCQAVIALAMTAMSSSRHEIREELTASIVDWLHKKIR